MKIHERTKLVGMARVDISEAIWQRIQSHDLTYGEAVSILASELASLAKYMIRAERHLREDGT